MILMKRVLLRIAILILLMSFQVGCGSLLSPRKLAPLSQYTITQWPTSKKYTNRRGISKNTLLVSTPIASPGYATNAMLYVTLPYKLKAYADNSWIASPANLLLPLIADRIRAQGYFKAVVTTPFPGATTFQLSTQLLTLQQEFLQPVSQVRMVIQATVTQSATSRVIASHVFKILLPAPGNNPYSGVLAANKAANLLTGRIAKFVVRAVKRS